MIYGYARVSSVKQLTEGNSLEAQEQELIAKGASKVIKEQFTGTKMDRPKLSKLISELKAGDTLMVTKLDRLARTVAEGNQTIDELQKRGINVHVLNMGLIEDNSIGRLIKNVLLAVSAFEKDMILERTASGREVARQKPGYKEGRPRIGGDRINLALDMLDNYSYSQVATMTGISKATLARRMKERKALKAVEA